LAANLAAKGFRVLLIEAGSDPESFNYQVPCFHAISAEEPEMAWNFFVHHYDTNEDRDPKYRRKHDGVLYPRAGTLGGCTAHNAMITVVPHDSDWNHIAEVTEDPSWRADRMWQYFQRVERCLYRKPPKPGKRNWRGHGFNGWLSTSRVDPTIALGDKRVMRLMRSTMRWAALRYWYRGLLWRIRHFLLTGDDPNDQRNKAVFEGMTSTIPLATACGRRNGAREFIRYVKTICPDQLTIRMNTLATRVLFDADLRATGVECREGKHLYKADPNAAKQPDYVERVYRCTREVILAGGAFNTPQLLMLSGIGPAAHLKELDIPVLLDRPGVGTNLQDRYEVGVVSEMKKPFSMLKGVTFKAPGPKTPADPAFEEWRRGRGLYTSNGAMAALIMKSDSAKAAKKDPDLFIFALPGDFHGYFPEYSKEIGKRQDHLTWAILKAHTENTGGTVRLRSSNPLETACIQFHYFEEGTDKKGEDLAAVVQAVKLVRRMNKRNRAIAREIVPEPGHEDDDKLREWVNKNAWGHHASCSCRMGKRTDRMAVVDSRFNVIGTKGLRIVDASVFPRIPGFFIVMPIYMISEKAADVIAEDAHNS